MCARVRLSVYVDLIETNTNISKNNWKYERKILLHTVCKWVFECMWADRSDVGGLRVLGSIPIGGSCHGTSMS